MPPGAALARRNGAALPARFPYSHSLVALRVGRIVLAPLNAKSALDFRRNASSAAKSAETWTRFEFVRTRV
jgi:hypothetical protein